MIELTCQHCNKNYLVKPYRINKSRFCSKKCSSSHINPKLTTHCEVCGIKIEYRASRIKYNIPKTCSKKCMGISKQSRIKRTCKTCGKTFEVTKSVIENSRGKYCSKECINKFWPRKNNRINKTCEYCGKNYKISNYQKNKSRFCSIRCINNFRKTLIREKNKNFKNGINQFTIFALNHRKSNCSICKKNRKIEVHHIDGNHNNNNEENWKVICASCHRRIHLISRKNNLSLQVTLKEFIELKLFLLTKLEFREFWNSPLD